MASPRKDNYQLSIEFITDESKAFAKLIENTKQYEQDIRKSQAAIKGYQKELQAANLDEQKRIELLGKIALEEKKVSDNLEKIAASGKYAEKIDLDKLVKPQLVQRARQLQRAMDLIPASSPRYKELEAELKRTNDQLATIRQRTRGVSQAMAEANTQTGIWGRALNLLKSPVALIGGFAAAGAAAQAAALEVARIVEETNDLRREISQLTGETGEALDTITVQVKAIAKTFEQEEREVLLAANTLAKEFGLTYEESLARVSEGFLNGANASGEFLDNIREYSVQFQAAGFSAEEFIGISIRAQQEGIFSDKGLDVVKEFGLRIREQTTAVKDAMEGAFGKQFTEEIFGGINDGSITTADALKRVAGEMKNTEIPANELQTVIADVFAAPGEDAGLRFIEILGDTSDGFFDASGEANVYIEAQRELFEANIGLAEAETKLAKQLRSTGDSFTVLWTNIKTVGLNTLNDLLGIIEYLPIKLKAVAAAIKQPFKNLFGSPEDAKSATDAYYETLIKELDKHETEKRVVQDAAAKKEADEAAEREKRLAEERRKRRQQAEDRQTDREVEALERRREKLLEVLKKFKTEEEIAELDAEEQKVRRLKERFQASIDEAIALENAKVKGATEIRIELEKQKDAAVRQLEKQLAEEALEEEKLRIEKEEREKEKLRQDLKKELEESADELLNSDTDIAVQRATEKYEQLRELAIQHGIDVAEIEAGIAEEKIAREAELSQELGQQQQDIFQAEKDLQLAKLQLFRTISGEILKIAGDNGAIAVAAFLLEKSIAVAEVIVSLQKELAAIRFQYAATRAQLAATIFGQALIPGTFALEAAQLAKAKVSAGIGIASIAGASVSKLVKKAKGGRTGPGIAPPDSTGERPAGLTLFHEHEWVSPRWMTQHPKYKPHIDWLESVRVRGFAEGGFTSVDTTPRTDFLTDTGNRQPATGNPSHDLSETNELLRMLLVQGNRPKPAIVKREDILDADEEDAFTAKYAGF